MGRQAARAAAAGVDLLGVLPYTALQSMVDDGAPHGRGYHVKSEWLDDLDDARDRRRCWPPRGDDLAGRRRCCSVSWAARSRGVAADATAFAFRAAAHLLTVVGAWTPAGGPGAARAPGRATCGRRCGGSPAAAPTSTSWTPTRAPTGSARRTAARPGRRLVALKTRLGPDNVFRLNQNVPPGPAR